MFSNSFSFQANSTKTVFSIATSAATAALLFRSFASDYVPPELRHYLYFKFKGFCNSFSSQFTIVIEEFNGVNLTRNELFAAAQLYLQPFTYSRTQRFRVTMPRKENNISISMGQNEEIIDTFDGVKLCWKWVSRKSSMRGFRSRGNSIFTSDNRYFELSFHRKHKDWVLNTYLPHVLTKSKEVKEQRKTLKLFTLGNCGLGRTGNLWQGVNLDHPATFDTLAMETCVKMKVMEDLDRFVNRKELYRRVGKAWKRGYLLFGPPGTGKSSLIAAMANYLNFDVYDLELTDIRSNSQLRKLLVTTANRSIIVVEDIDCSIELKNRNAQNRTMNPWRQGQKTEVTLSGLLNFIDGLWSSCGDERIIIFTTNHKDRLDPALLRPGRMDMQIQMTYCTPCGFKLLASNYLGITEHSLFLAVEELMGSVKVTPAEVGEQLMKDEVPENCLIGLIEFLEEKKRANATKEKRAEVGT